MSRRAHNPSMPPPPPPTSRAEPMGPPPLPTSASQLSAPSAVETKEQKNYTEKYYKLKRLYWDLQEKYKNIVEELHSSGMRNSALIQERSVLLDRIIELESPPAHKHSHIPDQLPASAMPRSLYSERAQTTMRENVKQAMEECAVEDRSTALPGPHIGPVARKREREEAEARAQQINRTEDQPTPAKRRRTKKDKEVVEPVPAPSPPATRRIRIKAPTEPSAPTLIYQSPVEHRPAPQPSAEPTQQQYLLNERHALDGHQDKYASPLPSTVSSPREEDILPVASSSPRYQDVTPSASSAVSNAPPPPSSALSSQSYPSPEFQLSSPNNSFRSPEMYTANGRHARPKRLKAHTVAHKTHQIPTVPRDPHGAPILPLNVGIMTVISLGTVCLREHFHTERYIFPIGYEVTRRYLSAHDPQSEVVYHCKILNGENGPTFQIIADDQPEKPIQAGTPTGAWSVVVRAANHIRNRVHSNSVSGPDFFGLGQNTIKHLIQQLPEADRLKDYVWQTFVEGGDGRPLGGRHAAVAPALAELASVSSYAGGEVVIREHDTPIGDIDMDIERLSGRQRTSSQSSQSTQSPISPYSVPPVQPTYVARPRDEPPYYARSPEHREPERYPPSPGREPDRYAPPPGPGHESERYAPPPHVTYAYSNARGSPESFARSQPGSYTRSPPDSYTTQPHESFTRSPPSSTTSFARGESYRRPSPPRDAAVPAGMAGLMNAYDGPPRYANGYARSNERDRDARVRERDIRERRGSESSGDGGER